MPDSHNANTALLRPQDTCTAIEDRKFTENQIGNFRTNRNSTLSGNCSNSFLPFLLNAAWVDEGEGQGYFLATQDRYYLGVQIFAWKPNLTTDLVRDWTKMDPTEFNLQYVWSYISTGCKYQEIHNKRYLLATLYELSRNQVFWPAFLSYLSTNQYILCYDQMTHHKGTSIYQVCCKENESKSFGNRNPFVGWTLACPSLSQLSHLNSQETPLNLKSLDSWPTFESIESVRVSCHAR